MAPGRNSHRMTQFLRNLHNDVKRQVSPKRRLVSLSFDLSPFIFSPHFSPLPQLPVEFPLSRNSTVARLNFLFSASRIGCEVEATIWTMRRNLEQYLTEHGISTRMCIFIHNVVASWFASLSESGDYSRLFNVTIYLFIWTI